MTLLRIFFAASVLAAVAAGQTISATTEGGKKVQLFADGTWAYVDGQAEPLAAPVHLTSDNGLYAVTFDTNKWVPANAATAGNRHVLAHKSGSGGAVFMTEGIPVAIERLPAIALANAKNTDPAAELLSSETATVNGAEVAKVEIAATVQTIPFHYRSYYFGGEKGNAALVVYAHRDLFQDLSGDIDELLGALEIHDTALHAKPEDTQRTIQLNEGGAAFTVDTLQWRTTKSEARRQEFQSPDGNLHGILISEPTQLGLDALVEAALVNAQAADPDAAIVLDEDVTSFGSPARRILMDVHPSGIELKFYSLLYSDGSGSYQVICYATPDEFDANRAACDDYHAGFQPKAGGE